MPAQGLKLQILLKAVDKVTGPVKRIIKVSQGLQQQVVGTQRQLSNVASARSPRRRKKCSKRTSARKQRGLNRRQIFDS